jgi:nitroreductase
VISNETLDLLMNRKSIRKFKPEQPGEDMLRMVVRAGQQAPFAMQLGSVLLSRDAKGNPFHAPWCFTVCVDAHRAERVMEARGWKRAASDLYTLLFGLQDACYMAQNMVIAGESLRLGSCFIGAAPFMAGRIRERYRLPEGVFPVVMLAMGYPDEDPPVRPRYPLEFHLFRDSYPEFTPEEVAGAMQVMDRGYLHQDYYRKAGFMIPLPEGSEERYSFDDYGWTEHISRKLGLWGEDPAPLAAELEGCGFHLEAGREEV